MTSFAAPFKAAQPSPPSPTLDLTRLIDPRESKRFALCVVASVIGYALIIGIFFVAPRAPTVSIFLFYGLMIVAFFAVTHMIFVGRIRGNAVRISPEQFPELYRVVEAHAARLGMPIPATYVMQAGGVLNAFALKYFRRKFVVLYADIIDIAEDHGPDAVSFIVGHELAHHKRSHPTKFKWLLPARIVPFLMPAYSRACEYTCDAIGNALAPTGAVPGLLALAAGRRLFPRVDARRYARQEVVDSGVSVRLAEIVSTHPHLTKRVAAVLGHASA